ncbi:hypothetical protein FKO01_41285 [Mesorhizobium sp. B2-3-3]|nr:hypothetical protein FKO01_41285 [Mesorhizobium sp. B2-3-3]
MILPISTVGAAPHCPAGHLSPYSDGEREAVRDIGASPATLEIGEIADCSFPLPVTIRGIEKWSAQRTKSQWLAFERSL